ncbi:LysR family transcriptional regulator [Silvimonas amylolytica]|uniref:LysR family transcriptional regulator n=1 Tax=Silvimonas amylolytica TaxID=449663 RepID=A0ABQ2PNG1_9NEIS|nr:LysR family transcriptional regulator [Silvimonas amylolytica]GGP26858.1 LysR family transcriptional regulator [Silvimonas amylolytica]
MLQAEDLALLRAISDTGSLSRAAAKLGKAPSTVSHAARQLESRIDVLLFDRRAYRLQLTAAGKLLLAEAERLQQESARSLQRVRQVASGWEERLWIVTDELLEFETLLPVIKDFDELKSGVPLRMTHEVLSGTWESLREGRAHLVIGATNEPQKMPGVSWRELGRLEWVFAVAPRHPLAAMPEPLGRETISAHRAVVVADSARQSEGRVYGVLGGQPALAVPGMRAKVLAQCEALGVGWLPRHRVAHLLQEGKLVEKRTVQPREPNILYIAWREELAGRALKWWLEKLQQPRLAKRLVDGFGRDGGAGV